MGRNVPDDLIRWKRGKRSRIRSMMYYYWSHPIKSAVSTQCLHGKRLDPGDDVEFPAKRLPRSRAREPPAYHHTPACLIILVHSRINTLLTAACPRGRSRSVCSRNFTLFLQKCKCSMCRHLAHINVTRDTHVVLGFATSGEALNHCNSALSVVLVVKKQPL